MRIRFACPSCGAAGTVDAASAGKSARCKQCGGRFTIPGPEQPRADVYPLDEPDQDVSRTPEPAGEPSSTFVASRGDEPPSREPKRARKTSTRPKRKRRTERAWGKWLIRGAVAAVIALAATALIAPRGTLIVGCILIVIGCVLILAGYGAGAFGAFSEDFIYGVLYLLVPLYAGYYLLTRWDDLWIWFTCATAGFGLILLGTELLRWSGVAA